VWIIFNEQTWLYTPAVCTADLCRELPLTSASVYLATPSSPPVVSRYVAENQHSRNSFYNNNRISVKIRNSNHSTSGILQILVARQGSISVPISATSQIWNPKWDSSLACSYTRYGSGLWKKNTWLCLKTNMSVFNTSISDQRMGSFLLKTERLKSFKYVWMKIVRFVIKCPLLHRSRCFVPQRWPKPPPVLTAPTHRWMATLSEPGHRDTKTTLGGAVLSV